MSYHAYILGMQQQAGRASSGALRREPWSAPVLTPEQQARKARVDVRAREVFGSRASAGVWCYCPNSSAFGRWISPWELAQESEEGCRAVLAELERIAATIGAREPERKRRR